MQFFPLVACGACSLTRAKRECVCVCVNAFERARVCVCVSMCASVCWSVCVSARFLCDGFECAPPCAHQGQSAPEIKLFGAGIYSNYALDGMCVRAVSEYENKLHPHTHSIQSAHTQSTSHRHSGTIIAAHTDVLSRAVRRTVEMCEHDENETSITQSPIHHTQAYIL